MLLTDLAKYTAQKEAQYKATEAQSWVRQHLSDTNPAARMAPDTLLMHVLAQTDQLGRVEALVKNP